METDNVDGDEEPCNEEEGELLEQDLSFEHCCLPQQEAIMIITRFVQMPATDEGVQSGDARVKTRNRDHPTQRERKHRQQVIHVCIVHGSAEEKEEGGKESEKEKYSSELQLDQVLWCILEVCDGFDKPSHCNKGHHAENEEQWSTDRQPAGMGELVGMLVGGFYLHF